MYNISKIKLKYGLIVVSLIVGTSSYVYSSNLELDQNIEKLQSTRKAVNLNLERADLRGKELQKVDLTSANLKGALLDNADLTDAILNGVNLAKISAGGTNFSNCKMQKVIFRDANLNDAILKKADLRNAVFSHTSVNNADFTGANLQEAQIEGKMDWTHAIGVSSDSLKKEENKNKSTAKKDIKKTGLGFAGQILGGAAGGAARAVVQDALE